MAQKIHGHGSEARYFWLVRTATGTIQYRSRHSTAKGVATEFARNGRKVVSVRQMSA